MPKSFQESDIRKEPKTRFTFEIIVSVALVLVFVLVIITGILSFLRLDQIILTVSSGIRPDRKLILVKEIFNNLTEAENSVKSYTLMKNPEDMSRFYTITEETGNQFAELEQYVVQGDTMSGLIDTLDRLVEEKFTILDQLLTIQDEFRVQQAMQEVLKQIPEKDTTIQVIPDDTLAQAPAEKKDSFFKRLFTRKDKKGKEGTDTLAAPPVIVSGPAWDEISSQVKAVQEEALTRERILRQDEWDLLQQDRGVMDRIRTVIAALELQEAAHMERSKEQAGFKAGEVKRIIFIFGLSVTLLLLLVGLVIFRYVRWNNTYSQALTRARNQAEELARAKERFLATMSHEIRTPMNVISGFTGQLLKSRLDEEQREQLGMVKKSSDHLVLMMNDLLDLSRLEAGKLELQETDFSPAEVLADIQQMLAPGAVQKKIELVSLPDPALPALVSGDPVRLRQILFNLTGNAIKFTDRGQVTVRATHEPDANGRIPILIEVSDTGIGIAASDLKKIFEEFEQGTGIVNQKRGGAGLGLAITRGLVELHGGRLSVESKPGKGSVFSARLFYAPAKGTAVTAVPAAVGKEHALAGLRVLVVDDEAFNRRLIKAVLGKYGCEVAEAGSGEEALEWIREHTADVILMDLRLPGMSGAGAAREIRRITEKTGTRIPVIAVSADVASSPDGGYTENGFDGGIPKPFEEEQLFKAIHAVIRQKDYDLKPLREASGGDPVFLNEMIRLFIDNTAKGLDEVQIYLTEQRPVEAADILHRISPPCHHLKAEHLYSLLKKAEQSLRAGRMTDPVNEMIHQARKEFDRIADDLKNQIEP